jgi:hypothetical protein
MIDDSVIFDTKFKQHEMAAGTVRSIASATPFASHGSPPDFYFPRDFGRCTFAITVSLYFLPLYPVC